MVQTPPHKRNVNTVFQNYALFPHLTVAENVAFGLRYQDVSKQDAKKKVADSLELVRLQGLERRRPSQLSGGQQQRVALARALARQPKVLLLDEPFSAVDAPARQALYRELAALRQTLSTPMVLVTHDLGEARRLADRVVILDAGHSLQTGTPAHVFASPRNARVAQLVGIQNHFRGRFHKREPGWGELEWAEAAAVKLRVLDKNRIPDGATVTWVIAGERIDVLADGEPEGNTLRCKIQEQSALGETSLCTLQPEQLPLERVTLSLSTAQLRSLGSGVGAWLRLRIAPEAIHIMPQKNGATTQ
jgi:molybdate transport system ATP-binding protein